MKILFVDDSELAKEMFLHGTKDLNHEIITVKNGKEAIDIITNDLPDLIVTDVLMPLVTGIELISWVRENYSDKIKIIVTTSLNDEDVLLEAFSLGVDDFVTKPIDYKDLSLRIERFTFN